ncbi:hypothetical protein STENM327S_02980 [Streptomyces tendae]
MANAMRVAQLMQANTGKWSQPSLGGPEPRAGSGGGHTAWDGARSHDGYEVLLADPGIDAGYVSAR